MNPIAITTNRSLRVPILAGVVLTTILGLTGAKAADSNNDVANTKGKQQTAPPQTPEQKKPRHHWYQLGRASWYGNRFQGHETASGESYDMNGLTCAHRTLPIGSWLKVTNLRNHRMVVVRVNDRGPVPENRIVDLSYGAAKRLGFDGLAPVRIDLVSESEVARLNWPTQRQSETIQ